MLDFLNRFYVHLQEMETEFESSVESTYQQNQIMLKYEQTMHGNYTPLTDNKQPWRVYQSPVNSQIEDFRAQQQNPFSVMIRWLKFEILDIEAILEAIGRKNEMQK